MIEGTARAWDLVLAGGRLIDPARGIDGPLDVAIAGGRVAAVGERLSPARNRILFQWFVRGAAYRLCIASDLWTLLHTA